MNSDYTNAPPAPRSTRTHQRSHKILIDIDGVVLNWEYAFQIWIESKGHTPSVDDQGLFFSIAEQYNITDDYAMSLVEQFNESASIGFLPPLRDSMHYIRKLHEEYGYIFHAITSVTDDPNAGQLRRMNLRKLFGPTAFEHIECLPLGSTKEKYLEIFKGKGHYWIEDSVRNAEDGAELGLKSLIMEHGYNMNYRGPIPLVKDWKEIFDIIISSDD
jgi:hypothetical protein